LLPKNIKIRIYKTIILPVDLRKIGWDRVDWIKLAQDKDQWRAPVNTALNVRAP
jgi:hypothetical protein